ncbi:MAG TPA: hypothetical protein VKB76_07595 [Ktedonobacterales bacterium]|nr:hypothetical protein [Ktedonobacterales bacterium]
MFTPFAACTSNGDAFLNVTPTLTNVGGSPISVSYFETSSGNNSSNNLSFNISQPTLNPNQSEQAQASEGSLLSGVTETVTFSDQAVVKITCG